MIRNRMTTIAAMVALGWMVAIADAAPLLRRTVQPKVQVTYQPKQFTTRVSIKSDSGRVAWTDVFRGMSQARGYDPDSLQGLLPESTFRLDSRTTTYVLHYANRCLQPGIRMQVQRPPLGASRLVIDMDRQAMLASQRRFKKMLRQALLPRSAERQQYGLIFEPDWETAGTKSRHLVVFVHGLNSHTETVRHLSALADRDGHQSAAFAYPNDQPIADSGRLLQRELNRLSKTHPNVSVSLVTHSMGGLVARAALEASSAVPLNVDRLIMVSPPNHGSLLAQFAFGLDLWEHSEAIANDDQQMLFFSTIEDGLAEATVDLEPGSIFLTRLNQRERNPTVKYTIILGTGAPCSRDDLNDVRKKIAWAKERCRLARFFGTKLDQSIADLEEVLKGQGDGCVAVKRGRLDGVDDVVELEFAHLDVLNRPKDKAVQQVYQTVLDRLKR